MPTNYKILGQVSPVAATNTTLYTTPAGTQAVTSTLIIANRSISATSFRIAFRPNGATLANEHYIAYEVTVGGYDSTTLTLGMTINAGDIITVYGAANTLSFSLFGSEITS
jgi:hypothetical protein